MTNLPVDYPTATGPAVVAVTHWDAGGDDTIACGGGVGFCTRDIAQVTCGPCRVVRRLVEERDEAREDARTGYAAFLETMLADEIRREFERRGRNLGVGETVEVVRVAAEKYGIAFAIRPGGFEKDPAP